jgi:diguanylate cyclase (GGDEF)-like protein
MPSLRTIALLGPLLAGVLAIVLWRGAGLGGASRDHLTGLDGRESLVASGESLLARARAGSIALLLFEVRGVRSLNERCGHRSGDDLIREAARILLRAAGRDGKVYRAGGVRFAVLLDRSAGGRLAGIVRSIAPVNAKLMACGHSHSLRLANGFASCSQGESFESLFQRCETRLEEDMRHADTPRLYVAPDLERIERRISAALSHGEGQGRLSLVHSSD